MNDHLWLSKQQPSKQFQEPLSQPDRGLQQHPHLPPRQRVPRKPKTRYRRLWLIIFIAVFMLIVIGAATSQAGKSNQAKDTNNAALSASSDQRPQTTEQPASKATSVPSPMAKSSPTSTAFTNEGVPVLGGTLRAFIAKFGQPNDHSSNEVPHFKRCSNSNVDQLILSLQSLENASGAITSIMVQACAPTSWHLAQATAVCLSYFPSDAKYQRSVQIAGTSGQFASVDKIYYSSTLAHVFATDNFTDANGKAIQPGLFDVDYRPNSNNDTSYIDSCTIRLGTQQTDG